MSQTYAVYRRNTDTNVPELILQDPEAIASSINQAAGSTLADDIEYLQNAIADVAAPKPILTIKGKVATIDELPLEGNELGDLWFVGNGDPYNKYVWVSAEGGMETFEDMGPLQITDVYDKPYIDVLTDRIATLEQKIQALESV